MVVFGFIVVLIIFGIAGLTCWACSDMPRVIREVALNTRRDGSTGPNYSLVGLLSVMLKVWAVLIWLFGLLAALGFLLMRETLGAVIRHGMM